MKKLSKSFFEKPRQCISTKESLKEVKKIRWDSSVLSNEKKINFSLVKNEVIKK